MSWMDAHAYNTHIQNIHVYSRLLPHAVVAHDDGVFLGVQDGVFSGKLGAPFLELGKRQVDEPFEASRSSPATAVIVEHVAVAGSDLALDYC